MNGSGLPLRMVELQLLNLLHAVQDRLHQEETEETKPAEEVTDHADHG